MNGNGPWVVGRRTDRRSPGKNLCFSLYKWRRASASLELDFLEQVGPKMKDVLNRTRCTVLVSLRPGANYQLHNDLEKKPFSFGVDIIFVSLPKRISGAFHSTSVYDPRYV